MNRLIPILLATFLLSGPSRAQLPARILLAESQEVRQVAIYPRKPGTTNVRMEQKDAEGILTLSLDEIEEIRFDLSGLKPGTLQQLYMMGNYKDVSKSLAGSIIPYFSFVDQKANSNELIKLFIESLYRAGNTNSVLAAVTEIEKYAASGEMRRFGDVYRSLTLLKAGNLEAFAPYADLFEKIELDDSLAPELWYGNARLALLKDDWKTANTFLAKIIVEAPMQTDWSGEALYLSATYHHSRTNLVVANQICQEIQIVVPMTEWPEKAAELEATIRAEAEEAGVELVEFGGIRDDGAKEAGEAEIDYRERQRKLKQEETKRLREELENLNNDDEAL